MCMRVSRKWLVGRSGRVQTEFCLLQQEDRRNTLNTQEQKWILLLSYTQSPLTLLSELGIMASVIQEPKRDPEALTVIGVLTAVRRPQPVNKGRLHQFQSKRRILFKKPSACLRLLVGQSDVSIVGYLKWCQWWAAGWCSNSFNSQMDFLLAVYRRRSRRICEQKKKREKSGERNGGLIKLLFNRKINKEKSFSVMSEV